MSSDIVYTHGHHDSVLRSHRTRTVANSAAYLAGYLRPGARVLDAGCGPGTISVDMALRVAPGQVVAIDAAEGVIAEAGALAAAEGATNIEFAVADLYSLPYPDASFDVVHAHQVLQHLADPVAALREMGRVCAPGGVVAARDADYAAFTWYPENPSLDDWRGIYRAVAHANGAEPDAGRRLLSWARRAGFTDITATGTLWTYATPEQRAEWGGMWSERIRNSAIAEQALSGGHATREDLERISRAWLDWAADEDGWLAIPHGEILCRTNA